MALSQDLINQFVKLTNKEEKQKEVTVNGTYKNINGEEFVQIDGSEIWTPVSSTVEAETGERVKVLIKNHTATVTGNISSPSARTKSVQDLKDEVDEYGNTINQLDNSIEQQGNSIIQIDNNIKQVENDILQANNAINQQNNVIQQIDNIIQQQGNEIIQINNDIQQQGNEITQINNTIVQQNNNIIQHGNTIEQQGNIIRQQGNIIEQQGNTIQQQGNDITQIENKIVQQDNIINQQGNVIEQHNNTIVEHGNNITMINSGFRIIDGILTGLSAAIINELKANHLDADYATIDFANINMAAVTKLFTESGIIKDLIVQQGKITGELVGVTLKGDLIEGNTIKADKLVVRGEDGIYYKLNIDGLNNISTTQSSKFTLLASEPDDWDTNYKDYYIISNDIYTHITGNTAPTWQANTYYKLSSTYETGLDGTVIVAHSVTADKIAVNDLVAFGATIGGFNITSNSIYSGGKNTVNSTSRGIYLDNTGQIAFGDNSNYVKFFKDTDNQYKIMIRADQLYIGSSSKTISEQMEDMTDDIEGIQGDYLTNTSFVAYQNVQNSNDNGIKNRLSRTEVTIYGDPEDPEDPDALINKIQKIDKDADEALDRVSDAEDIIQNTGLDGYTSAVKINQRFLDIEDNVDQIKRIFQITGGSNLIQNSVGYFSDNSGKPLLWNIASGTIYSPYGYDADLTGATASRGKLFCSKGSLTTTPNNITGLISGKAISLSFKYKNGDNATTIMKIFSGAKTYFEKTFSSEVSEWTEYTFDPNTDSDICNNTFICFSDSLQISITSTNSTDDEGFEISDLMLNYGDVKTWELYNGEVYGAIFRLSSLGIEVTATTAKTKNFMTTDGILVYSYDPVTDRIIGTEPITKITDNGTLTNMLESTGDIITRDLVTTVIKDSSNNDIYVEYIRD